MDDRVDNYQEESNTAKGTRGRHRAQQGFTLMDTYHPAASSFKFHGEIRKANSGCSAARPEIHAMTVSRYGTEFAVTTS